MPSSSVSPGPEQSAHSHGQPSPEPSPWQICPLLPVTTSLFQTLVGFIKSSQIILAPNFSASPDPGCPLPQRWQHLKHGAAGHLSKAKMLCKALLSHGHIYFQDSGTFGLWFLETIKRNKSGCFSLSTGGGMIFPSANGGAFPYIYIS